MENVKAEVSKPFPQEKEFKKMSARLEELNILFNMDEMNNKTLNFKPDEDETELAPKVAELER